MTEIAHQPQNERQDNRQNDTTGQGEIKSPVSAAEFEVAGQPEKADFPEQHQENADPCNGQAGHN